MPDRTAALVEALSVVLPAHEPLRVSHIPAGALDDASVRIVAAYALVYGGAPVPQRRLLDGAIHTEVRSWSVVVVSNSARGARLMADRVLAAVDNRLLAGARAVVSLVTSPIRDDDEATDWRWSSTVEVDIRD